MTVPRKPKPCPVCGGPYAGYATAGTNLHDLSCTPALRALVRAAVWEYRGGGHSASCDCRFCRAVRRWRREKKRAKGGNHG